MNRTSKLITIFFAITFILLLDAQRWNGTLRRIEIISQLDGRTLDDAYVYLEINRNSLAISDIQVHNTDNKQWMTVSLNKVSVIGAFLFSLLGADSWLSDIEISGLLQLPIENGHVAGCIPMI